MKLNFKKNVGWFVLGLIAFLVIAADVTTTMFDSTYFSTSDTSVSLKGSLTNWFKLTTNSLGSGGGTVGSVINTTAATAGAPLVMSGTNPTNAIPSYSSEPSTYISTNYTILYTDDHHVLKCSSATNVTWTFNDGCTNGFGLSIKVTGAGSVIITNASGKTFDGLSSVTLPQGVYRWKADGTNYYTGVVSSTLISTGNKVWASDPNGASNPNTMRAMVNADLPSSITGNQSMKEALNVEGAYYLNGLNCISIGQNMLATYKTNQYLAYITTNLQVAILVRNLLTGTKTLTVLTNTIADNDEHRIAAISLDSTGRVHLAYGSHADRLRYIVTTNSQDLTSFGVISYMIQSTNEDHCTYPIFIKNPFTQELYFTFRQGDSISGDQMFYHWNTNTPGWEIPTGTSATGKIIAGTTNTTTVYLNGIPKWDSQTNLWFSWSWSTTGTNENLIKWDGTTFKDWTGATQTIPAIIANVTPALTKGGLQVQNNFCIDANDKIFIPYVRLDASTTNYQEYVLENTTGSFVERQLTFNIDTPANLPAPYPYPYPSAFSMGGATYIVQPDVFGPEIGLSAYQSNDGFVTHRRFFLSQQWNPNWALTYDPDRIRSNIVSFPFMHANDFTYGQIYVNTNSGNVNVGQLSVMTWTPSIESELSKGLPKDIYGPNSVNAAHGGFAEATLGVLNLGGTAYTNLTSLTPGSTILIADGTTAKPGLAFNSETNNGFFRATASTLSYTVAANERIRFDAGIIRMRSDGFLAFANNTAPGSTADAGITRDAINITRATKGTTGTGSFKTGGFFTSTITKTTNYTATLTDYTILLNAVTITNTLPTAVGIAGQIYVIKEIAIAAGTVATTSSQTIDGSTTYSLVSQNKYVVVQSDGANWYVIGNN